jgi:hypothetical protein
MDALIFVAGLVALFVCRSLVAEVVSKGKDSVKTAGMFADIANVSGRLKAHEQWVGIQNTLPAELKGLSREELMERLLHM